MRQRVCFVKHVSLNWTMYLETAEPFKRAEGGLELECRDQACVSTLDCDACCEHCGVLHNRRRNIEPTSATTPTECWHDLRDIPASHRHVISTTSVRHPYDISTTPVRLSDEICVISVAYRHDLSTRYRLNLGKIVRQTRGRLPITACGEDPSWFNAFPSFFIYRPCPLEMIPRS